MKKFLRRLLLVFASVLGLLVLTAVLVALFLPVDRISRQVEKLLEESTGAEVVIGAAEVKWFPHAGVMLKDFQMQGTGEDLAAATGSANEIGSYSLQLDQMVVRVAVRPLLKKEVQVVACEFQGVDLDAVNKGKPYRLRGGELQVSDLQFSLETVAPPVDTSRKIPVGEKIPEDLVLEFEGRADSFTAQAMPLTDLKWVGELDRRILTLEEITASLGKGELFGALEIDYERHSDGILDFEAEAEGVPAAEFLQTWVPDLAEKLDSDLDAQVRGNCQLGTQEVIQQSLTLNGGITSGEGTLWAREWLQDVLPYLGSRQDLADIEFRSLTHDLRIEQGRYLVEDVKIDGIDTQWQGDGSFGLDGTIDLDVAVRLPAGFTPDLGQWSFLADTLRDSEGRVKLDMSLSGMAAKPKVGMNLGSLQDAAKGESGEALKKGLGGLLDKWKNR